jgi:UDP-glucose 4-epimerase
MMTLEESVDLVLHAFNVGQQGDIFVKKSPSTTIHAVAEELIEIMKSSSKIKIIGMRHGEKLYESLVSSEEMVRSMLEKEFYRITADNRDINYEKYFVEGEPKILENTDYNSDTAPLLSRTRLREMLLTLPIVQKQKRLGLK